MVTDPQRARVDLCLLRLEPLGEGILITLRMIYDVTGRADERTVTTSDTEEFLATIITFVDDFRSRQRLPPQ